MHDTTEITEEAESLDLAGPPDDAVGGPGEIRHTTSPCLSPDGSMLACVVTERTGYPRAVQRPLGLGGLDGAGPERDVVLPVNGPVRRVAYSPSGKWLACEVAPDGGERERIWLVTTDPADRDVYPIDTHDDATEQIVCWDGDLLALTAFDSEGLAEGRLVDPETGESTIVDSRMGGALVHARDGAALFRVGARGHRELLRIVPDGRWWPLLPVDTGSTTDAGVILDAGGGDRPMRMIVRSDHSADRMGLLAVEADEEFTESWPLAYREDADLDRVEVSLDRTTAVLLWNVRGGLSEIEVLDLRRSRPRVIVRPPLPDVVASSPTLTADGRLLALTVQSLDQPPRIVMYDVERRRWTGEPPRQPDPVPQLVRFTARDGLELSGWLYRADPADEPTPTVVHLHGGPEGQSRPGYNDLARRYLDIGVTYFEPNVRGSTGSGRFFSHADDRYGRFAGIDDVEDALLHLVEQGIADPDRAVVSGRSYGGYLVNATLVRHPGRWRGGIAACGMSDLQTFYRTTEPWIAAAAYPKYGNPLQERELLREASPLHLYHHVDVPVLFVHGAHDTNVPLSETEQAVEALRRRGVPVDVLLFEDEGHEFVKLANRQLLGDRVVDFCQEVFGVRTQEG
ncbi:MULTISPECIES: S9 family peptidase [unclassified Dietzia]|uniref:alpha/beta hydrolase family protein n=1 Tax=unclassified Dietzia TaxID=2617939 RepID=UPI000D2260BA|nr:MULTISPECIES: prolyl oligopeptidase family serine peptidase [unclassified Dietzia]AVZ40862.1 S9 family peptidase [Dietzia sp. JS16-p6b]MBB1022869.1 S9 family peptidase [Dietzia sp. DQ12-76]MBB1029000.1 S9 family peptidase [Dietzia sp. DQ11-38-2]QGW26486.1 serine peptidase [Dietzia sp. DQ12-45-1b]